jgi:hypothetical protein
MERGRAFVVGLGIEVIAAVAFVAWDDPPTWLLAGLLVIGLLLIVYGALPALAPVGKSVIGGLRAAPHLRVVDKRKSAPSVLSNSAERHPDAHLVESEGVLWNFGGYYFGTDDPYVTPVCPLHRVELLYRANGAGGVRDFQREDRIGDYHGWGKLWCAEGRETYAFEASPTVNDAMTVAEKLLKKKLVAT